MNIVLACVAGGLVAGGVYLMMRRSMIKLVIGLGLLSHGANLAIFVAGGLERARSLIIPESATTLPDPHADPVPQALILTAIVISFGLQAFIIALILRTYKVTGTDDVDLLSNTREHSCR